MHNHSTGARQPVTKALLGACAAAVLSGCAGLQEVRYALPRAGQVSLAVYDAQGCQVRTLLAGERQAAGRHRIAWDGLDRHGSPLPPGTYRWKLLMNDGLESEYVTVVGQTLPDPARPWVASVGSHQGPSCVARDADGALYMGSRNSEGPPVVIKLAGAAGPVRWTRHWQTRGPIDMRLANGVLHLLTWELKLQAVDPATGDNVGAERDVLWPGDARPGCDTPVAAYGVSLAADRGALVLAYRGHDRVRWIDATNGATLREVTVAKPAGVAASGDGAVYVLSADRVVALGGDNALRVVVPAGVLSAPGAIEYDAAQRQILVADGGGDQRIRRFALDGRELGACGRKGGRLDGAYVAADFRDVSCIRSDGRGGFLAVESDHLRRVVHIAADGSVVREWFGGSPFYSVVSADPARPEELWYNASYTTLAVAELDARAGTWKISRTYTMPEQGFGDGLFPALGRFPVWRVRRRGDVTYLVHVSPPAVLRVDEAGRRLVPVALASHKPWNLRAYPSPAINEAMARKGLTYADPGSDGFTWADANANGVLDPEEFRFHNVIANVLGVYGDIDEDWNVYIGNYGQANHTHDGVRWINFDFQGSAYARLPNLAAPGAAPVWDWSRLELSKAKLPDGCRGAARSLRVDAGGGVVLGLKGGGNDRHGLTWPDSQWRDTHLVRVQGDRVVWDVSKHVSPGGNPAAQMREPEFFPGVAHGCVIACDRNAYPATAWTEDGLFAGYFMDRLAGDLPGWVRDPGFRGFNYLPKSGPFEGDALCNGLLGGDDNACAGSVTEFADGTVLWSPRTSGRSAVFRVRGWDNWFRAGGTVRVPPGVPAAPGNGDGLTATYFAGMAFAGQPVATRVDPRLWFSTHAGPEMKAWEKGPCAGIATGASFSVRWTGALTAPRSEDYWFCVYNEWYGGAHSQNQRWKPGAGFARVWLNGVLLIDGGEGAPQGNASVYGPARLEAGQSYDLRVEYACPGGQPPELSLSWCSPTMEWERVPKSFLHASAPAVRLPVVRLAAARRADGAPAAAVALDAPTAKPLKVMCRVTGSDYVARAAEVVVPAGARAAQLALPPRAGRTLVALVPSADYAGDGAALALRLGDDGPVEDGLVARYAFDEAEGVIAHDAVGSRHAAFNRFLNPPAPVWRPTGGRREGALEFAEEWVPPIAVPDVAVRGDFTLALWFRTRQADAPLFGGLLDLRLTDGRPAGIFGGWHVAIASDAPRLDDGQWHHVAFVWNESGGKRAMALFADGRQVGSGMGPGTAGTSGVSLGRCNSGSGFFRGAFDDLRIYSRALCRDEIIALGQ